MIVDHEISPSQARNLERATGAQVLDRTGVIVEIFHRHAHSREAKLQVEMARLKYVSPRLRESSGERRAAAGCRRGRVRSGARSPQDPRSPRGAESSNWTRSSATTNSAVTRAAISFASRWSATRTPASRRSCVRSRAARCWSRTSSSRRSTRRCARCSRRRSRACSSRTRSGSSRSCQRMGRASVAPYLVGVVLEHAGADETSVLVRLNGASTVQIAGG